ncbi:Uroporphyrinogen-III synthase [Mycena kentingensis (nom. inval.)]|nr:Uroporphyrinogen-III synthase [Mycena kentingensis (nom. inval.)]
MQPALNVLLLRTPDSPDRYEDAFTAAGHACASVPVLETVFVNADALRDTISRRADEYGAVVITSGRACEAWGSVVEQLEGSEAFASSWRTTPFYVVGKSSASKLSEIQSAYPNSPLTPHDIRGADSGNGEQLAKFIVSDLPAFVAPLHYLTGDKNRDTLPDILHAAGLKTAPLQVYETRGSSTFTEDLKRALALPNPQWWIVFFAPSAAEFVSPFLREHFLLDGSEDAAKVAAIGPTTANFLRDQLRLTVDAVAQKPTPEHLLRAIIDT